MKRNRRGGRADRLNNNNKQQRHELWSRKCNSVWRRGSSWSVHSVHSWSCSWLQQHLALRGSSVLNERARIVLFLLSYRMAVHPCTPPLSTQTTHSPAGERSVTTEWPLYQTELGQRRPDLTGEFTHSLQLPTETTSVRLPSKCVLEITAVVRLYMKILFFVLPGNFS